METIKKLLTGKINGETCIPEEAVKPQILAAAMACQILFDYPNNKFRTKDGERYRNLRGVMLADEVGGGKTFEVLAIISKLLLEKKSKKERFRVLVIANPSIRSKWEWRDDCDLGKFIQQTNLPTSKKIDKKKILQDFYSNQIIPDDWSDIKKKRQGFWLTSFGKVPKTKRTGINSEFKYKNKFPDDFFDYIIVDEAHSLKKAGEDSESSPVTNGAAIRKIFAILNSNESAKLILLSATPFQNSERELHNLLRLLEYSDDSIDELDTITGVIKAGINKLQERIEEIKNSGVSFSNISTLQNEFDNDINKLLNKESICRPKELHIGGAKSGLDDYLRDLIIRNTKTLLKPVPKEVKLKEKDKLQYLFFRDLVKTTEEESQMFSTKLSQMVSSTNSFKNRLDNKKFKAVFNLFEEKNLVFEAKFDALKQSISNIELTDNKNVITVFISWKETIKEINELLKEDYEVFQLTGDVKVSDRQKELNRIKEANSKYPTDCKKIILLASRVGNEGLDFDEFSNRVIHYDNNYNPAVIDQRNGRVYRGKNIKSKNGKITGNDIKIYQIFLSGTYDQRILFIEQTKREMKNFYLGDASLRAILEETLEHINIGEKRKILNVLKKFKIDLTPSEKYLLPKK